MVLKVKTFRELTAGELYEILLLRSEAFIVEQGGRYQDLDRIDYRSIHIFYEEDDGTVSGCLRIFQRENHPGTVQVGRVVARKRKMGIGTEMMDKAADIARECFGAKNLFLTGRKSAKGFYLKCGYHTVSEELGGMESPYYEFMRNL